MKFIYKGIGLISILFIVASCSFSKKQTMNKAEANDSCKIEVVVLDPGHFHAPSRTGGGAAGDWDGYR